MTVPVSDRLSQLYVGNGTSTRFDFTFRVFDQEDESGVTVRVKNGTEFEDVDKALYQVSINQDEMGGFITFNDAPNSQTYFYVAGQTPIDQLLDITNYDNFYPDAIERALDKLTAVLQEWNHLLSSEAQSRILADINYDALAQTRENELKAYIDAIASTITGQPVFGLLSKFVDTQISDAQNQFLYNKKALSTVESVADLQYLAKWEGRTVYVNSYYTGVLKGGGGTRVYVNARRNENDGFLCINGWVLDLYSDEASVYLGGIRGNGLDETDRLETIITKAKGKNINLEGLTIKTNGFRIGSNTKIFNGTLDFSSSNIIDPDYRFYDGYIIGDNRPRNYNAEYNPNYASLPQLENIEIDNIEFVLPTNPTSAYRAVFFHKINGLKFTNNKLNSSNHHTWLQVVGGHDGIDLSNVTPQKYVRNMPNGRCSNIVVSGNYMKTDWDSTKTAFYQNRLCHIVSSENIDCSYNTVINTPCAIAIDHFNRSASIHHNFYEAEKAIVNTLYQHMDGADSMAYYVGQGSYDVTVSDNYAHNYGQAGVYIEAAKAVSVKSNRLSVDSGINTNISKVGIQLQSNVYFQAGNNTNVVGNVSDSNVFDNVVYSATRAFETNGVYSNSHEKINVFGNTFSSINSLGAVTLHNIYQSTFNSNNIFSTLMVAKTDTLSVFDNTVLSSGNYALNLNADEKYSTTIKNNKFKGFNYASLISNSLSHDFVISKNLLELDQNMNLVNKTGSGNLKIIDFILNDSFSLQSESLNIAAGAITGVLLTCDVSKPEWGVDVSLIRWQGLSILASYTQEGSIVAIVQNTGSTTFSGKVDFRAKLHSMIFS